MLYREVEHKVIQGEKLIFIPLGISQIGIAVAMIVDGMADFLGTPLELESMTNEKRFKTCLETFSTLPDENDPMHGTTQVSIMSQILSRYESAILFHELVSETFPSIAEPWKLTNEAKGEMLLIYIDKLATNIQDSVKQLREIGSRIPTNESKAIQEKKR